ncbi:MAG: IS630 family transposase, partial [Cyanobacteria bacterium CAN_BIN43]|nr:IS630 family transposase [Cyanobacteria bacterium CAN_BIN43]
MIKLTFSAEDIEQLHYERFHHPHPRVQRKMEALYLKSQGYLHRE